MKKIRRNSVIFLLILMCSLFTMLTGCSSNKSDDSTDTKQTDKLKSDEATDTQATESPSDEPTDKTDDSKETDKN